MTRKMIRAAALAAFVGSAAAPSPSLGRANCYRWDPSDSFRCFDCMKQEWIEGGWHRVNTCPPRQFPKREAEPPSQNGK